MSNHTLGPYIPAVVCGYAEINALALESGFIMLARLILELTDDIGSGVLIM